MKQFDRNLAKFCIGAVVGLSLGLVVHKAEASPAVDLQTCMFEAQVVGSFVQQGRTSRAAVMEPVEKAKREGVPPDVIINMAIHLENVAKFFDNNHVSGDYERVATNYFRQCTGAI